MTNTFYFPHDYNARNDVKCLFLRQQLGMEGYGIFWFLIECLADSGGKLPMKIIPVLSMQMQVPDVKVLSVIQSFDLFELDEDGFFSNRLNNHLELRKILSEKGKKGAKNRWGHHKKENNSNNKNSLPNGGAITLPNGEVYAKESKVKESKVNKEKETRVETIIFHPPDLSKSNLFREPDIPTKKDVFECFVRNGGNKEMAKSFWDRNEATGWYFKGSPITNFRNMVGSYVQNWKKNSKDETNVENAAITRRLENEKADAILNS